MAHIRKTKSGSWSAEVARKGVRETRNFATKAAARLWALKREAEIVEGAAGALPCVTLRDAVQRYMREVTSKRHRARQDALRFGALLRDYPELADKVLHEITPADIAAWRDSRLQKVSGSSVLREAQQYRPIWQLAINEWGWCKESPWRGVRLPPKSHARTRRVSWREARAIFRSVGFHRDTAPQRPQEQAIWAWAVALHTALRAGEIMKMSRSTVDLKKRVYTLAAHKTMEHVGARRVPFTKRAARILAVLDRAAQDAGRDEYFTIGETSRDVLFRKVTARLMIKGMYFHDSRAAALTWLAKRYDVMTLARISGHTNINMLYNTYYRESAEDVAERL